MENVSALVLSRTLNVDFRFLAIPEDLNAGTRTWLTSHVKSAMVYPEKLRGGKARWALFRNRDYLVAGIVCENQELARLSPPNRLKHNIAKDSIGREIYLFAGYVFKDPKTDLCVPRDRPLFEPLLTYVDLHWEETESRQTPVDVKFDRELPSQEPQRQEKLKLNPSKDKVGIWPPDQDDHLWAAGFQTSDDVALCLGLPSQKYALQGLFLDVSVEGRTAAVTLDRGNQTTTVVSQGVGERPHWTETRGKFKEQKTDPEWPRGRPSEALTTYQSSEKTMMPPPPVGPAAKHQSTVGKESNDESWMVAVAKWVGAWIGELVRPSTPSPSEESSQVDNLNAKKRGKIDVPTAPRQRVIPYGIKYTDEAQGNQESGDRTPNMKIARQNQKRDS